MSDLPASTVQAWARLVRAERMLLEGVERRLKAADLPPLAWYDVLLELDRAEGGRLRQYQIGEKVLLRKDNLSRLLDRIERDGLVRRERCEADRRGADVVITAAGRRLRKRMWPVYERAIREQFAAPLSDRDLGNLHRALGRLIDANG